MRTDGVSLALAGHPPLFVAAFAKGIGEFVHLVLHVFLALAVGLLQLADEHVAVAGDLVEVVVGEVAPLRAELPLVLHPVALDLIPVHRASPPRSVRLARGAIAPQGHAVRVLPDRTYPDVLAGTLHDARAASR